MKRQEVRRSRYQLFPALPADRHEALEQSALNHGMEKATVWDDEGNLLDGWERESVCDELGISCPREVRHFAAEADKFQFVLAVNAHRRPNLSQEQKRAVITAYLLGDSEIGDNALGQALGVSKNTVAKVRHRLEATRQIDKLKMTQGRDSKMRPVTYTKRIITNSPREFEKAKQIVTDLPDNCAGKTLDITTAKRRAATNRNRAERESRIIEPHPHDAIRLHHCRFQDLELSAGSTNLVLTDIPYGQEFLPQVQELGQFAQRTLVETGLFVCLCGHYWLDKVMDALGRHLTYRWVTATVWNGAATPVHIGGRKEPRARVLNKWKPILVYSKGNFPKRGQWCDVINVNAKEKDWHPWQQPLEEVETMIRYFSNPGDLVVDPCGGGFTTAIGCLRLGRRCVSCDVVAQNVERGLQRLQEAQQASQLQAEA